MRLLHVHVLPYVALLGTAVAAVVDGQQVNLALTTMLAFFLLAPLFDSPGRLPVSAFVPLGWVALAALPGTALFIARGGSPVVPLMQIVGLVVGWFVMCNLLRHLDGSVERAFTIYLRCATAAAALGVMQQVGWLLRVEPLYDLRWLLVGAAALDYSGPFLRVASFFTEPSYFACFLMPALYLTVLSLSGASRRVPAWQGLLMVCALLCTFSTIGYLGLLLCVGFALRLSLRNVLMGGALAAALVAIGLTNPAIMARVDAIPNAVQTDLQGDENLSALANGLGLAITTNMVSDHPVVGVGFGAFRVFSMDYLDEFLAGNEVLIQRVSEMMEVLALADGGSMYMRIPAEVGFGGCALFAWLVVRNRRPEPDADRRQLATAALLYAIVFSIRSGQLVRFELLFFCALYALVRFPHLMVLRGSPHRPAPVLPTSHELERP